MLEIRGECFYVVFDTMVDLLSFWRQFELDCVYSSWVNPINLVVFSVRFT